MPIIDMIYSKQLVIGLIVVVFFKLGVGTKLETTGGLPRELRLDSSQVEFMYSEVSMVLISTTCRTSGRSRQSAAAAGHLVTWPA